MEIFWKTIAEYNSSTWVFQAIILVLGLVLTVFLFKEGRFWQKLAMKIYLTFLYLWIAVVYYYTYCKEREYNDIMALFWGIMALVWIWDAITGYTSFERTRKHDVLAYILLAMPFVYPAFSIARGLVFPGITSPVMPCSVAVFTMGLLLLFSAKVNMFAVLLISHWSLIGLLKTYYFNIPEDYLLVGTTIPALYFFFKDYFIVNLQAHTKPSVKYVNLLLICVCVALGVLLAGTMAFEYFDLSVNHTSAVRIYCKRELYML